jgi:hypothetical protein
LHPTENDAITGSNKINLSGTPTGTGSFWWIVDWGKWYDDNGFLYTPRDWNDVYVLEETLEFSITPAEIYSTYVGTNIFVMDDSTGLSIENDDFTMFADQTWLKIAQKPV